jgi:hypothetical protein
MSQNPETEAFPVLQQDAAAQLYLDALKSVGASDQLISSLRDQLSAAKD